jgi:hypothetical protein
MGLIGGMNMAWLPYWYEQQKRYQKIRHLDINKEIKKDLVRIYNIGGIIPVISSYKQLDIVSKKMDFLYKQL